MLKVRYIGTSPARVVPGAGRVKRGDVFEFPEEYRGQDSRAAFEGSPLFEIVGAEKGSAKQAPKAAGGEE